MAEADKKTEAEQLLQLLDAMEVPTTIDTLVKGYSAASKMEVAAQVARTFDPPPHGRLLARLIFIATAENRSALQAAFIVNLRSPDPAARLASLHGLATLRFPALEDLARLSLRDEDDHVVAAACDVLIPRAKQDRQLWQLLHDLYRARSGDKAFYLTSELLKAHGFARATPEVHP